MKLRNVLYDEKTVNEWATILDMKPQTIRRRLRAGWSIEAIKNTPLLRRGLHQAVKSPTWRSYHSMMNRCCKETDKDYKNYGARGICVCDEWKSTYWNFLADMGERPKNKTLGRIDNNSNYCKENCRWEDAVQQNNNRRNNKLLTFCGETKTRIQWCRLYDIKGTTLDERLKRGWDVERALTEPVHTEHHNLQIT